jgi:hypothetical protein
LENKNKIVINSPKDALKRKNKVEEGGDLGSRVKREHECRDVRAQKMMRSKVEPSIMPTMVRAMFIVVQVAR